MQIEGSISIPSTCILPGPAQFSAARKWPAEQPACASNISMMTLVFEDLAAALAVLQLHKSLGENDALWGNTAFCFPLVCDLKYVAFLRFQTAAFKIRIQNADTEYGAGSKKKIR